MSLNTHGAQLLKTRGHVLILLVFVTLVTLLPISVDTSKEALTISLTKAEINDPLAPLAKLFGTSDEKAKQLEEIIKRCGSGQTCSAADRQALESIMTQCSVSGIGNPLCTPKQRELAFAAAQALQANPSPMDCNITWTNLGPIFSEICWGRTISVIIGTALITLAGWLLAAAALLFNVLVDHTIVSFGYLFSESVKQAIEVGWSGIRDIANIVIIGMFVFIAINIILGVKEFGDKKKVAHVLIVAVLINFSLLFTKVIIDASNFTAYQFYKASGLTSDARSTQTTQGIIEDEFVKKGIAGEFIKLTGLTSVGNTYKALSTAAFGDKSASFTNANAWYALLHGLVTATLFLVAAGVFLYGGFLLVSRAVLLIFLMLTAAIAFASWLVPHQYMEKGFARWWESLLKAAFFAPILMALLWATLIVARAVAKTTGAGSLGGFITNPSGTLDLNALFSYVIIIGLLFASFKAANMFSQSIPGFARMQGVVGGALRLGTGIPLALGARFAGFAGRNVVGRGFARYGRGVGEQLDQTRAELARVPIGKKHDVKRAELNRKVRDLEAGKHGAEKMARREFSLAGTGAGSALFKRLGVPSFVAGGKVESFGDRAKRVSEDAAKRAVDATTLSEDQKKAIREEAERQAGREHGRETANRTGVRDTARTEKDTAETTLATEKPVHEKAIEELEKSNREVAEQLKTLARDKEYAPAGSQIHQDHAAAQKRFDEQSERIEKARSSILALEQDTMAKKRTYEKAETALKEHEDSWDTKRKEAGDKALRTATGNLEEAAKILAPRIASGRGTRILSLGMDPNNSYISQLARSRVAPRIKTTEYREKRLVERAVDKELDIEDSKSSAPTAKSPDSPTSPPTDKH